MGRRLAEQPEVARRSNDSPAKVVLPYAIDNYTSRKRVVSGRYPASHLEPPTSTCDWRLIIAREEQRETTGYDVRELGVAPSDVKWDILDAREESSRSATVSRSHCQGWLRGELLPQAVALVS